MSMRVKLDFGRSDTPEVELVNGSNPVSDGEMEVEIISDDDTDTQDCVIPPLPEGTVVVHPEPVKEKKLEFKGPEFKTTPRRKPRGDAGASTSSPAILENLFCTACGRQVNPWKTGTVKKHKELKVLICKKCFNFLGSGEIAQDEDGMDEQCRWCGEGGRLTICDTCPRAFCKGCIMRNFGRKAFTDITENDNWECYGCDASPLVELQQHCGQVMDVIQSADDRDNSESPRPEPIRRSTRTSLPSTPNKKMTAPVQDVVSAVGDLISSVDFNEDNIASLTDELVEATSTFQNMLRSVQITVGKHEAGKTVKQDETEADPLLSFSPDTSVAEKKRQCAKVMKQGLAKLYNSVNRIIGRPDVRTCVSKDPVSKKPVSKDSKPVCVKCKGDVNDEGDRTKSPRSKSLRNTPSRSQLTQSEDESDSDHKRKRKNDREKRKLERERKMEIEKEKLRKEKERLKKEKEKRLKEKERKRKLEREKRRRYEESNTEEDDDKERKKKKKHKKKKETETEDSVDEDREKKKKKDRRSSEKVDKDSESKNKVTKGEANESDDDKVVKEEMDTDHDDDKCQSANKSRDKKCKVEKIKKEEEASPGKTMSNMDNSGEENSEDGMEEGAEEATEDSTSLVPVTDGQEMTSQQEENLFAKLELIQELAEEFCRESEAEKDNDKEEEKMDDDIASNDDDNLLADDDLPVSFSAPDPDNDTADMNEEDTADKQSSDLENKDEKTDSEDPAMSNADTEKKSQDDDTEMKLVGSDTEDKSQDSDIEKKSGDDTEKGKDTENTSSKDSLLDETNKEDSEATDSKHSPENKSSKKKKEKEDSDKDGGKNVKSGKKDGGKDDKKAKTDKKDGGKDDKKAKTDKKDGCKDDKKPDVSVGEDVYSSDLILTSEEEEIETRLKRKCKAKKKDKKSDDKGSNSTDDDNSSEAAGKKKKDKHLKSKHKKKKGSKSDSEEEEDSKDKKKSKKKHKKDSDSEEEKEDDMEAEVEKLLKGVGEAKKKKKKSKKSSESDNEEDDDKEESDKVKKCKKKKTKKENDSEEENENLEKEVDNLLKGGGKKKKKKTSSDDDDSEDDEAEDESQEEDEKKKEKSQKKKEKKELDTEEENENLEKEVDKLLEESGKSKKKKKKDEDSLSDESEDDENEENENENDSEDEEDKKKKTGKDKAAASEKKEKDNKDKEKKAKKKKADDSLSDLSDDDDDDDNNDADEEDDLDDSDENKTSKSKSPKKKVDNAELENELAKAAMFDELDDDNEVDEKQDDDDSSSDDDSDFGAKVKRKSSKSAGDKEKKSSSKKKKKKSSDDDDDADAKSSGNDEKSSGDDDEKSKKKDESSDGGEDSFQPLARKRLNFNSKLLDARVSDSDSDIQVNKSKGKKRKRESDGDSSSFEDKKKKKSHSKSDDDDDSDDSSDDFLSDDSDRKGKKKKGKGKKRRRIKNMTSSSENEEGEQEGEEPGSRKKIRKIKSDKKLGDMTKAAAKAEEERRKRVAEKQKKFNGIKTKDMGEGQAPITTKLVLEQDEKTEKPLIQVNRKLIRRLKPHQVEAVQFMWDCMFESVSRCKKAESSAGCILAHCMGLGKTLSVVSFVHTMMSHKKLTKVKTCLVVSPLNTVLNWENEFDMWLDEKDKVDVYELSSVKQNYGRVRILQDWHNSGGVMIIGYEMLRNLSLGSRVKSKKHKLIFQKTLINPGPDMVVCDEGHLMKNAASALSKSINQIRTKRRVVLTGTPLQNNLIEYHCMVDFVKPNLLGTKKEFANRFVNPIINGQHLDSTGRDVRIMKNRAHVLHELLAGCVQRRDYSALTKFLPPKQEYVISVRLSELQISLYEEYLKRSGQVDGMITARGGRLFKDYQSLMKIWTHPWVLKLAEIRDEGKAKFDDEDSFIDDENSSRSTTSGSSSSSSGSDSMISDDSDSDSKARHKKRKKKRKSKDKDEVVNDWKTKSRNGEKDENDVDSPQAVSGQWWAEYVKEEDQNKMEHSGKLMLLFNILRMSEEIGDKVLIFSQSLLSLDIIEYFLEQVDTEFTEETQDKPDDELKEAFGKRWLKGEDYFRLDGSTSAQSRQHWASIFNDPDNHQARLFLISTRAGGLGINLVGANRVIIFDASWNPSHDVQSIFRIYRFGQTKPCYIYRFLAQGTMEEKIYDRQVTKLSLSQRVVDEHQVERHFTAADLSELYAFRPDKLSDSTTKETLMLPKDVLLAEIMSGEEKDWFVSLHEHDSLLENLVEQELTEEEKKAAWDEYEDEKKGLRMNVGPGVQGGLQGFNSYMNQDYLLQAAQKLREKYPNMSQEEIQVQIQRLIMMQIQQKQEEQRRLEMMERQQLQMQQHYAQLQQQFMQREQFATARGVMPSTSRPRRPITVMANRARGSWIRPNMYSRMPTSVFHGGAATAFKGKVGIPQPHDSGEVEVIDVDEAND